MMITSAICQIWGQAAQGVGIGAEDFFAPFDLGTSCDHSSCNDHNRTCISSLPNIHLDSQFSCRSFFFLELYSTSIK